MVLFQDLSFLEMHTVPVEYFKRQTMRCDIVSPMALPQLPGGFRWQAWHPALVDVHADVLERAFADETDSQVFPSLRTTSGCRMLVRAIVEMPSFCPQATWLIVGTTGAVGAIQCMLENGDGSIQNVAVVPTARTRGLGTALVLRALAGFAAVGVRSAELEVTVANCSAVELYRRLGFRAYKTSYRSVETPDRSMVGLGI